MTADMGNACGFQAIAAMSRTRVIGAGNRIPWHLPEDFKWFKAKTMGHDLIMGRRTFESIGRPLPGRRTFVLSRSQWNHPGVTTVASLAALPEAAPGTIRFICGGGEIYRQTLPACSDLFLTRVKLEVEGDCHFPPFESLFRLESVLKETDEFDIEHYVRNESEAEESSDPGTL